MGDLYSPRLYTRLEEPNCIDAGRARAPSFFDPGLTVVSVVGMEAPKLKRGITSDTDTERLRRQIRRNPRTTHSNIEIHENACRGPSRIEFGCEALNRRNRFNQHVKPGLSELRNERSESLDIRPQHRVGDQHFSRSGSREELGLCYRCAFEPYHLPADELLDELEGFVGFDVRPETFRLFRNCQNVVDIRADDMLEEHERRRFQIIDIFDKSRMLQAHFL